MPMLMLSPSPLLRSAAAAVAFFMAAAFWRRAVKGTSIDDARAGSVDDAHAGSSHQEAQCSRADGVPAIFLSHSGRQKPFVEHLYDALQAANHTAFFDKHTLRKGSPFPPHIIAAARGCKLGVVVLSDDFLTSKWPMKELEILAMQRGPNAILVPLFYKISPEDLKSPENLVKWRRVWKEMVRQDDRVEVDKWEKAVKALRAINGLVFVQGTSEVAYIKTVVRIICDLMPAPILYDLFGVKGHQRLAQEVASHFEEEAKQCDKVCMVGLYGVGGMGKTTMCKIMTNFYNSNYLGKCHHIEFPSDSDDKKIVQECTRALKKLANLSDEHLLNKAESFDQVVHLMKENLTRYDVFLVIDNVWEKSVEATKRILGVRFSANSKVLLTSRSDEVLKDLVRGHSNSIVVPLPSPDLEEALQIFQENFELGDLTSLVSRNLLDSVLKRAFFSGKYHALALTALGRYVKRMCLLEGLDTVEHNLSDILQEIGNIGLQNVEDLIQLNYVQIGNIGLQNVEDLIQLNYVLLTAEKKHMFLDIVVGMMESYNNEVTYEKAKQWLSLLYKEYPKSMITNTIYELAMDGLIQFEIDLTQREAANRVIVHDLYSELAQREAAKSARFFTDRSAKPVEEIQWESLERVILRESHLSSHFIEELQQKKCPKLRVLCAKNMDIENGINLDLMPSLCVLDLKRGTLRRITNWSAAKGLTIVHLVECKISSWS